MNYLELGASLYVPATRTDLAEIANRSRYPALRSVIFCTEDAISAESLPHAIANLRQLLTQLEPSGLKRFIRVRNPDVLQQLLDSDGIQRLDGVVLPKVTQYNFRDYSRLIPEESPLMLMPTLETAEVFDLAEMKALRGLLLEMSIRRRILSLRIGGNDLLHLLGLRRSRGSTIYDTPLATTIAQLVTTFRPVGLPLTAPVFDRLDDLETLTREVRTDVDYGLLGKTAIHPLQVPLIESRYRVAEGDWDVANRILQEGAPPVFRYADTMCEPSTHRRWAEMVIERSRVYGIESAG
jgi:citrate lyase beta subunit